MPNAPIEFILVRDRETGIEKNIPVAKYEVQKDLWAQVGRRQTVTATAAPTPETSATESGTKSGQKAASKKETS